MGPGPGVGAGPGGVGTGPGGTGFGPGTIGFGPRGVGPDGTEKGYGPMESKDTCHGVTASQLIFRIVNLYI